MRIARLIGQMLALSLCFTVLMICAVSAETAACPPPQRPTVGPVSEDGNLAPASRDMNASGEPELFCSNTFPWINETFYLSWNEPAGERFILWVSRDGGEYENLGDVSNVNNGYPQVMSTVGTNQYCLMAQRNGTWSQSNFVDVYANADEDTVCAQLAARGMNNTWNILVMVYRNVSIGGYQKSFTDTQINALKTCLSQFKHDVETISNGRMRIGTVDLTVIDTPVKSASNTHTAPYSLTYGPTGDVNFNYIVDHKDITLAVVYTPLLGMNGGGDWLGLGGGYETISGKRLYTLIINEIYPVDLMEMSYNGKEYSVNTCVLLHETLHAVETNSRTNGWRDFQPIHDYPQNNYPEEEHMRWYHDEMCNTLNNGNQGFKKQSFYVQHYGVSAAKANGYQTDDDSVTRFYVNGVPRAVDLVLPAYLQTIQTEAFLGLRNKSVFVPANVQNIESNAFHSSTTIYGYSNTVAERYADSYGCLFIPVQ